MYTYIYIPMLSNVSCGSCRAGSTFGGARSIWPLARPSLDRPSLDGPDRASLDEPRRARSSQPRRPSSVQSRPRRSLEGPTGRLDTILGRFGVYLGGSEALALERARARSTFDEIDFFRLGDRFGVDFVPADAFWRALWPSLSALLGHLGRSLGAPGGPERAFGGSWGDSWQLLGVSWGAFGRSWALLGASWTLFCRLGVDLESIFGGF